MPLPRSLESAFTEWRRLEPHRDPASESRRNLLERLILFRLPAATSEQMRYRMSVLRRRAAGALSVEESQELAEIVLQDLAGMDRRLETTDPARQSTAERRERVLAHLRHPEDSRLSDREIARRVGVSPQTVNNWRRRLRGEGCETGVGDRIARRGPTQYWMKTERIGKRLARSHGEPPLPVGFITLARANREYFHNRLAPARLAAQLEQMSRGTGVRMRKWRDSRGYLQTIYPVTVVEQAVRETATE
jgi:DNA-binding Lrp family transcriptional regulator